MKNISVVFFDLYNTLIYLSDKRNSYIRFFSKIFKNDKTKIKQSLKLVLNREFTSFEEVALEFGGNINNFKIDIIAEISSAVVFKETRETLFELKKINKRMGIISNLASFYKSPIYDVGLDKYFEKIICSCSVGVSKPLPEIYLLACKKMKVKPESALMVGDSINSDYYGAINAGLKSVLVDRRGVISNVRKIKKLTELLKIIGIN